MDRGAWQATVHRVAESDMTEATGQRCFYSLGGFLCSLICFLIRNES